MSGIGIVVGLADEARLLADTPGFVECCGPGPAGASRAAKRAIESGANALLSFGVAGALDPLLRTGQIVVATEVFRRGGGGFPCDETWRNRCVEALGVPPHGAIFGSDIPIAETEQKRLLFESSGAVAVDMESHAVGRAAAEAKLPFLAVRAIADIANQPVPAHLAACFNDRGEPRSLAIIASLIRYPSEIFMLPAASRAYRAALEALAHAASAGGAALRNV